MAERGLRVFSMEPHTLQSGEYGKWAKDGNWYALPPGCFSAVANLAGHEVVEHEDGTITVSPSIAVHNHEEAWHGFLERGVWRRA